MVRLGDVCSINMGQSPASSSYNKIGKGIPFFQGNADFGKLHPTVRSWCNAPTKIAEQGDILISVRAPIGALNIANVQCCIGRGLAALTVNEKLCYEKYLWYALECKVDELNSKGTGSTFKAINKKTLAETEISLPPLDEQRRIAAVLDKVSGLIAKRRAQLDKLEDLVKSRFVELFGGIHNSNKHPYKLVKELTNVISGGTPSRDISEYWEGGTIPWVKTTELQNNMIVEVEEYITEKGLNNSSAKIVPPGTVLIAMYGQGKTRGMTAYLGIEACTNQACACILPSDKINQTFLWQFLILSYDNLRDMAKGGNQPNLNGNIIKNYPILYPPKELQEQFAAFVEQTDKSKVTIQQSLDKLEVLKKALMQQYFGQV